MKKSLLIALLATVSVNAYAVDSGAVVGAAAGAAVGAAVGHNVNGQNGAIIGAAVGGATGAAVGSRPVQAAQAPAPVAGNLKAKSSRVKTTIIMIKSMTSTAKNTISMSTNITIKRDV
jgi:uncharacterized membrane protein